jgi:predicted nuclease with TOPRIM domain
MLEIPDEQGQDVLAELEQLESKVQEVTILIERLREEKRTLERECGRLERQCELLRGERSVTVGRLTSLIAKVDALRGEA